MIQIENCPSTLQMGFQTYSPLALKNLFDKKKVSHLLPFQNPNKDDATTLLFNENRKHISISGVQDKLSLKLTKNILRLSEFDEKGDYILKPIPTNLLKINQVPANEHLTMQIAEQVYGIKTAVNGLVFFEDGTPAYLTKRFDRKPDGMSWGKEDFATLAGKTVVNDGPNFKYNYSYEAIGSLIRQYVSAWQIDIELFFRLVVFNYLFSNGDAHLKNFSLLETPSGDYKLSPAYDLINTKIHVDDSDFALSRGLFEDNFQSDHFKRSNHACLEDFREFAKRIGVKSNRIDNLLTIFLQKHPKAEQLVTNSFLDKKTQKSYWQYHLEKLNHLRVGID